MLVVSYSVFGVLDDDMDFCASLHQVACESERYVIGVFVFVERYTAHFAHCSRVGASASAYEVKARSCKFLAFDCYVF